MGDKSKPTLKLPIMESTGVLLSRFMAGRQKNTIRVEQRAPSDSFLACLNMLTNTEYRWPKSLLDTIAEANKLPGNKLPYALRLVGIDENACKLVSLSYLYSNELKLNLIWGRPAIIQVPSYTQNDSNHFVYWDGHSVHDPNPSALYTRIDQCLNASFVYLFKH